MFLLAYYTPSNINKTLKLNINTLFPQTNIQWRVANSPDIYVRIYRNTSHISLLKREYSSATHSNIC